MRGKWIRNKTRSLRHLHTRRNGKSERVCSYCGRKFHVTKERKNNAVKYCCEKHRHYARQDQVNESRRRYYRKYKSSCNDESHSDRLGSGWLGGHPSDDFKQEQQLIYNEYKRLRLRRR